MFLFKYIFPFKLDCDVICVFDDTALILKYINLQIFKDEYNT